MMKNFFKSLMLVAVAAMAFTACQNDVDDVNAVSKGTTLTFTANLDTETRVAFGDADAEGIRKVTWEKGDLVSFIVYDDFNNIYDYVNDVEVKADGAIATFNVTFEKTIQTNYTIKAYVGKYVANLGQEYNWGYDYYDVRDRGNTIGNQYPTDAGLSDIYLSAEVPYLGDNDVTITFGHDYAYGKMTVNYPVDFEEISVSFYNENWNYAYATIYGDDVEGNVFWFYCNEISDVSRVEITAYDAEYNEYVLSKDVDAAKNFRFEKGLISSFSVKDFMQKLVNPKVTGEIVDNKAVFTWTAVEHATSYDVYVNYELVEEAYTGTSYEVSLEGYEPFSSVNIEVVVNPEDGYMAPNNGVYASVVVPITKDAEADFTYYYDTCVLDSGNKYYYRDSKNPGNFASISFNSVPVTGIYTPDGELSYNSGSGASVIAIADRPNEIYGTLYEGFWLSNGQSQVYVECDENGVQTSVIIFSEQAFGLVKCIYSADAETPTPEATELTIVRHLYKEYTDDMEVHFFDKDNNELIIDLYTDAFNTSGTYKMGGAGFTTYITHQYKGVGLAYCEVDLDVNDSVRTWDVTFSVGSDWYHFTYTGNAEPTEPEPSEPVQLDAPVVTATASGNAILLSWNEVVNAEYYTIYLNGNYVAKSYYTTYNLDGLDYSTEYSVYVVAYPYEDTNYTASEASAPVTVTTEAEPEVDAIQLTAQGAIYDSGYGYMLQKMSDDSGNNKVTLAVLNSDVNGGLLVAGDYSWQSSPGYLSYSRDCSFLNNNTYVNGTKYANSAISNASMSVDAEGVVTLKFTAGGNNVSFVCAPYVEPEALATPNVTATVEGNTIKASWNAVPGAGSYALYINGEWDSDVIVTSVTCEDLEYSTDYTISVVAKPANAATHKESAAGSVTVTTEANPNAGGGETSVVEVTSLALSNGAKKLSFNDGALTMSLNWPNNYNPNGTYELVAGSSSATATAHSIMKGDSAATSVNGTISVEWQSYGAYLFIVTFNNVVIDGVAYTGTVSTPF